MEIISDYITYITEGDSLAMQAVEELLNLDVEKGLAALHELDRRNLRGLALADFYLECKQSSSTLIDKLAVE